MIKFKIKEENTLTKEDKQQLKDLLVPLFSFSYHFSQSFQKYHHFYYNSRPKWRLLLYDDQKLIGSLSVVKRQIYKPLKLLIGGIGNLAIAKDYQNKGLALLMLDKAHELLQQNNIAFSLLFCTENKKSLYLKAKYLQIEKPITFWAKGEIEEETLALFFPILLNSLDIKTIQKEGLHLGRGTW